MYKRIFLLSAVFLAFFAHGVKAQNAFQRYTDCYTPCMEKHNDYNRCNQECKR